MGTTDFNQHHERARVLPNMCVTASKSYYRLSLTFSRSSGHLCLAFVDIIHPCILQPHKPKRDSILLLRTRFIPVILSSFRVYDWNMERGKEPIPETGV
jgi:hypothetical protein